jgi:hypothetical protein
MSSLARTSYGNVGSKRQNVENSTSTIPPTVGGINKAPLAGAGAVIGLPQK